MGKLTSFKNEDHIHSENVAVWNKKAMKYQPVGVIFVRECCPSLSSD